MKTAVPTIYKMRKGETRVFECTDEEAEAIVIRKESDQIDLPTTQGAGSSDSPKLLNKLSAEPVYKQIEFSTLVTKRNASVASDTSPAKNSGAQGEAFDAMEFDGLSSSEDAAYSMNMSAREEPTLLEPLPKRTFARKNIKTIKKEPQATPSTPPTPPTPVTLHKTILNNIKIESLPAKSTPPPRRVILGKRKNVAKIQVLEQEIISPNQSETETHELADPISVCAVKEPVEKIDNTAQLQEMTKQIEELKRLMTEKVTANNQNGDTVPIAPAAQLQPSPSFVKVEKGPAMTKIQLFNGIRKYLNPSMIALLRMEMFGASDRDYRPDEKDFAKELFNLNNDVYNHMKDEWRFRLPPTAEVQKWLEKQDDEEVWELC